VSLIGLNTVAISEDLLDSLYWLQDTARKNPCLVSERKELTEVGIFSKAEVNLITNREIKE
jgi:hypothetical protein